MTYQVIYVLLLLIVLLTSPTLAYYSQPNLLTVIPFKQGLAYIKREQSIIVFGGESNNAKYTNDLNQLTQTATGYNWTSLAQQNIPPAVAYGQAVISKDGNSMIVLGGITNTTVNQVYPLQLYQYNFNTATWSNQTNTNNVTNTAAPLNRWLFSATPDTNTGQIYIYGGVVNDTSIFSDFWLFDPSTSGFTAMPAPTIRRYGHTASLTSNGKLVIIGGVIVSQDYTQNILAPMDQLQIFDIASKQWTMVNATVAANNILPSPRAHHSAVLINGTHILMFGGNNNAVGRLRASINSVYMLDTTTWTWTSPDISGILPSRRAYAVAEILDDRHLTVAFGKRINIYIYVYSADDHFILAIGGAGSILYNDINALDTFTDSWLQSFTDSGSTNWYGLSTGVIIGVSVVCAFILIIICILLWKFGHHIKWIIYRIHSDIWKPRSGEPIWAETARICSQLFFLFLFLLFLAFVIRQAIDSPNVTQTIQTPSASVEVPDIRFCFDGYPVYADPNDVRNPGVACQTDNGYSCNQFIKPLNMSVFQPNFADKFGMVSCYLFRSDVYFQLTGTSGANNGSRLIFSLYGDSTISAGAIHLSTFPKEMDPIVQVYNINDGIPSLLDRDEVLNWQNSDLNDLQSTNVYTVSPFTYSAIGYTLSDHQYLQDVGWNYVGFLPVTNSTPEISTAFRMESANPTYNLTHSDIGVIAVTPDSYTKTTKREVKMYTLVNALGFVGGVFGILVTVQAWLFGYRPLSPFGIVHRWSVGNMKQSILRGLYTSFKTNEDTIPMVTPVHRRFSMLNVNDIDNDINDQQRITMVEERMQTLERVFKAYYVNDEVFRSLDNASKMSTSIMRDQYHRENTNHRNNTDGTLFDKLITDNKSTKGGDYELVQRNDTSSSNSSDTAKHHHDPKA
ncbi:uncharacterized protein BX664DRAFT_287828 [Halteromyces radiatus]|uniref:uncharacterized protein n=1 Tax=Halteromyces radiatus TaxID=101107 RepID=UPI00221F4D09|nr:uncharacterized protein BX664DRAFT_287828 [Halteromyces radiatus]KAI8076916.1 hypothetical protein BX664DRAFT_287828 [Halteromyces radiatus]